MRMNRRLWCTCALIASAGGVASGQAVLEITASGTIDTVSNGFFLDAPFDAAAIGSVWNARYTLPLGNDDLLTGNQNSSIWGDIMLTATYSVDGGTPVDLPLPTDGVLPSSTLAVDFLAASADRISVNTIETDGPIFGNFLLMQISAPTGTVFDDPIINTSQLIPYSLSDFDSTMFRVTNGPGAVFGTVESFEISVLPPSMQRVVPAPAAASLLALAGLAAARRRRG